MLVYTTLNLLWQKNKHPYKYVYRKVQNYLNEGNVIVCFLLPSMESLFQKDIILEE